MVRLMLVTDDRLVAARSRRARPGGGARRRDVGAATAQARLRSRAGGGGAGAGRRAAGAGRGERPARRGDGQGAAGVHLGPDDLPVALARGGAAGFIIGASAGSTDEAAAAAGADYWGVGPWRTTGTKADAGRPSARRGSSDRAALGREALHRVGGCGRRMWAPVLAAGGAGVAVVSGILGEDDIEAAARRYGQR